MSLGFISPGATFAQDGSENGNNINPNQQEESSENSTATTSDNTGNLWWIVPLVSIPLLFFFLGKDRTPSQHPEEGMAYGYKGGRAKRKKSSGEEVIK